MQRAERGHVQRGWGRVGVELAEVEVQFRHLRVEAEAFRSERALPSLINSLRDVLEVGPLPTPCPSEIWWTGLKWAVHLNCALACAHIYICALPLSCIYI